MEIRFIFLWSDVLIYSLFLAILLFLILTKRSRLWQEPWSRVARRKLSMVALVFLLAYSLVALLDSIHFQIKAQSRTHHSTGYRPIQSLLDICLQPLGQQNEKTYSAPFSLYSRIKTVALVQGKVKSFYPRLKYGGRHLQDAQQKASDILEKTLFAIFKGISLSILIAAFFIFRLAKKNHKGFFSMTTSILSDKIQFAGREVLIAITIVILVASFIKSLSPFYHILGTGKVGTDILYESIKSIRTGLIIGTLTTLITLPFAVFLGTYAGYFGGWLDDTIQYLYTTLSSIPAVLLISAAVLSLNIFISNHVIWFPTLESRADARLLALCFILGITSWTSLCRLLRAETLKLREMDYVKASIVMGVRSLVVIWRHITPNLMHIILITVALDFSGLVLAEAVLSYVGVGVDPITPSWGNMINSARLDLARQPVVWWPLFSAFIFMFTLVLSANYFADALKDAFDPRLREKGTGH
jgi:peptide/nickel transport system permease protein